MSPFLVWSLKARQWWMVITLWILWVIRPWQPRYFFCSETLIFLWLRVNYFCFWNHVTQAARWALQNGSCPKVSTSSTCRGDACPPQTPTAHPWVLGVWFYSPEAAAGGGRPWQRTWSFGLRGQALRAGQGTPALPYPFSTWFQWICCSKHQVSPLRWATAQKRGLLSK